MKRKIDPKVGAQAVKIWLTDPTGTDRQTLATAVRYSLEELNHTAPGRSVEIRIPPCGAVQAIAGTTHRRGTPPAVIETNPQLWLQLATGQVSWHEATETDQISVSGVRADLAPYLPLVGWEKHV